MTLSICLTTWNSKKFIKDCLESILQQTIWSDKDFDIKIAINIVDNGSQDGTIEFIRNNYPFVHLLQNVNNLGFSRSYNQAIQMQNTDFVLIMNPDVILEKNYLEKILTIAKKDKEHISCWGGKILRVQTRIDENDLPELVKTKIIDSCGLEVKKSRQVKNIGEGEKDEGQFDNLDEVFGFSGCCFLIRKKALEDIKFKNEYFDEDFFAYQEDFDLAYRLQLLGWQSKFIPNAVVYHFRSAKNNILKPWLFWKIIKARKLKSKIVNQLSYRNHLFVLRKNEVTQNFYKDFGYIFWFEFKKFIYILLFETKNLIGINQYFKKRKIMKIKRQSIQSRRKISAEEIRKWIV